MTATEIITAIRELAEKQGSNFGDYFAYDLDGDSVFGEIEEVDSEGDCEGGGEYAMKVLYFKDHDIYLKIEGAYYSYNGTDWDDNVKEVRPKQKTITVFE